MGFATNNITGVILTRRMSIGEGEGDGDLHLVYTSEWLSVSQTKIDDHRVLLRRCVFYSGVE